MPTQLDPAGPDPVGRRDEAGHPAFILVSETLSLIEAPHRAATNNLPYYATESLVSPREVALGVSGP